MHVWQLTHVYMQDAASACTYVSLYQRRSMTAPHHACCPSGGAVLVAVLGGLTMAPSSNLHHPHKQQVQFTYVIACKSTASGNNVAHHACIMHANNECGLHRFDNESSTNMLHVCMHIMHSLHCILHSVCVSIRFHFIVYCANAASMLQLLAGLPLRGSSLR